MDKQTVVLIIFMIVLISIGIAIVFLLTWPAGQKGGGAVACTLEARICPDGTAVGRVGPDCEFTPCPVVDDTPTDNTPQGCPEDAMVCPDGSVVVRKPPACEFEECPEQAAVCGNGLCESEEQCETCPVDCGICMVELPPAEQPADPCDQWIGWDKKAECYSLLAQAQSDIMICENINITNYRYQCYKDYAAMKDDIPVCMYLEGQDELDCIKYSSLAGNNYTKCLEIPENKSEYRTLRYDCLAAFAKKSLDETPCYLIESVQKSDSCISAVATALDNLEGCLLLKSAGLGGQYECFLREANESKDVSICDNIGEDRYLVQCIFHIIRDNRLMSNRCTGLSLDSEYLCRAIADDDYTLCELIQDEGLKSDCNELWPCVDTDGGRDYYEEGEVLFLDWNGERSTHGDSCGGVPMTMLEEYYCTDSGGLAWETFVCPGECDDGECK